jgi:hypothetical protein
LVELEEDIFIAGFHQQVQKERENAYHDSHIKKKAFKQGDIVLVYDNKFIKHPLLSLKFCPHMATRTQHRQNRNEVIHGTGLIPQALQKGQKLYKVTKN